MSTKYTPLEPGEDVVAGITGYYTPQKKLRLKQKGREI